MKRLSLETLRERDAIISRNEKFYEMLAKEKIMKNKELKNKIEDTEDYLSEKIEGMQRGEF